jgi:hypothetical protein
MHTKAKAVPPQATEAGRGGIAPTHYLPRH